MATRVTGTHRPLRDLTSTFAHFERATRTLLMLTWEPAPPVSFSPAAAARSAAAMVAAPSCCQSLSMIRTALFVPGLVISSTSRDHARTRLGQGSLLRLGLLGRVFARANRAMIAGKLGLIETSAPREFYSFVSHQTVEEIPMWSNPTTRDQCSRRRAGRGLKRRLTTLRRGCSCVPRPRRSGRSGPHPRRSHRPRSR
jgi:hypothetical protein